MAQKGWGKEHCTSASDGSISEEIKDTASTSRYDIKPMVHDARMKITHNQAMEQNLQEQLRKIGLH